MIASLLLLALLKPGLYAGHAAGGQDRAYSFLSYKDTIFAIREPRAWTSASHTSQIPNPEDVSELEALGMNSVRGRYPASLEGWDHRTETWSVACEDFDDVMAWKFTPEYPRVVRRLPKADASMRAKALKMLAANWLQNSQLNAPAGQKALAQIEKLETIQDIQVFSTDLDDSGVEVKLVSVWARYKDSHPGIVFLDSSSAEPATLLYTKDGWPRVLTVVDLLHDKKMEVIAGGVTTAGKSICMWRYDHHALVKLAKLASYESHS